MTSDGRFYFLQRLGNYANSLREKSIDAIILRLDIAGRGRRTVTVPNGCALVFNDIYLDDFSTMTVLVDDNIHGRVSGRGVLPLGYDSNFFTEGTNITFDAKCNWSVHSYWCLPEGQATTNSFFKKGDYTC